MFEELAEINAKAAAGELSALQATRSAALVHASAETLQKRQKAHARAVESLATSSLEPLRLGKKKLPIKTWKDADIADKMARRALRMDEEGGNSIINVALLSGGPGLVVEESDLLEG